MEVKTSRNYLNNVLNGTVTKWKRTGEKKLKQIYDQGTLKEQKEYMYYATGQIDSTIEFKYNSKNKIINKIVTKWSPNGQLISKLNNGNIWKGRSLTGGMRVLISEKVQSHTLMVKKMESIKVGTKIRI